MYKPEKVCGNFRSILYIYLQGNITLQQNHNVISPQEPWEHEFISIIVRHCPHLIEKDRRAMALKLDGNSLICAHINAQSLLIDLFKAFCYIESSHKSHSLIRQDLFFLPACATCYELPSNISTMFKTLSKKSKIKTWTEISKER